MLAVGMLPLGTKKGGRNNRGCAVHGFLTSLSRCVCVCPAWPSRAPFLFCRVRPVHPGLCVLLWTLSRFGPCPAYVPTGLRVLLVRVVAPFLTAWSGRL